MEIYTGYSDCTNSNDHPKLAIIMAHLNYEYSIYKYTVYRCASKLWCVKKLLYTSKLQFKIVLLVLEKNHLNTADDLLPISPKQLLTLLKEIFEECNKSGTFKESCNFEVETATNVLANFLWNVFNTDHKDPITLMEFKEIFLILCDINSFEEVVAAYFLLMADHNRCITRFRFECLLNVLVKLLTYLDEGEGYGLTNIPIVLEQCFAQCPGINGLNEFQFHNLWTITPTRFSIYANLLALIKRVQDTEKLVHYIPCRACQSIIVGIRFKCQSCKRLSLCMKCFAIGFNSNQHTTGHRMCEVFAEDDPPPSKWSNFLSSFLCSFFFNTKRNIDTEMQLKLTSHEDTEKIEEIKISERILLHGANEKIRKDKKNETFSAENNITSFTTSENIKRIIDKLSTEKDKLTQHKNCLDANKYKNLYEFLESHDKFLYSILENLKKILQGSTSSYYQTLSSTPHRLNVNDDNSKHLDSILSRSINGADINKSYIEANKSDYSINDVSTWFHQTKNFTSSALVRQLKPLTVVNENEEATIETDMKNFRELLSKVKEIVEDSYCDNSELANATQNFENALDNIIKSEENKRKILN